MTLSPPPKHSNKIMIVAGEASGDMHGAKLVEAMRRKDPDLLFCGVGGEALRQAGVEILYEAAKIAVVGIIEVFSHLRDIRHTLNGLIARVREQPPDLIILIDFPDFNLLFAKKVKKHGIPIFYYISPQVWAWRAGRVRKIARLVDQMAVILPFEKKFYLERGMRRIEFVGHPLLDTVHSLLPRSVFRNQHAIADSKVLIGMLPGSRRKEISSMLPAFIEAAKLIKQARSNVCFALAVAPTIKREQLGITDEVIKELELTIITDDRYEMMVACDLVMAASGTVTLELAILKVPMVVAYRISPLTYFLGRRLIKVSYASLVNLVAERGVVQELLQKDFTAAKMKEALLAIWPDTAAYRLLREELSAVGKRLGAPGASDKAAEHAIKTMRGNNQVASLGD